MKKEDPFSLLPEELEELRPLDRSSLEELEGEIITQEESEVESLKLNINLNRIRLILFLIIIGLGVLFFRLFYLQIIQGEKYLQLAESNRIRIKNIKAPRGIFYDQQGEILVENIPHFSLYLIPGDLPEEKGELEDLLNEIASIIEIPASEMLVKIEKASNYSFEPILIQDFITYDKALLLEIKATHLPGVTLETSAIRRYPTGQYLTHVLGYTGKINQEELEKYQEEEYLYTDYLGKTGLELYYENLLKGQDGKKKIEVDSLGKEKKVIASQSPQPGSNIVLAIDLDLQKKVYEDLEKAVKGNQGQGGAAVVFNPRDGRVLALASYPSFDGNKFVQGLTTEEYQVITQNPQKPLFNRVVAGEYPPGSTFKPLVAAAALQEVIINARTTVNSVGGIQIDKWYFPDWKAGGHGVTNVIKGIAESVNTFFYMIGGGYENFKGLGLEKIVEYAKLFGLSKPTGIDLPNESDGFLPSKSWKEEVKKEPWYIGDTYHLAIGQGDILVTPLQVAAYTAALANGGTLYQPQLVKSIINPESKTEEEVVANPLQDNFISQNNLEIVKKGLREAVLSGSSRSLADLPFAVAGKTGTAQVAGNKKTHAWFTSFAPFENPEIVVTVLIENGGEGHEAALPVAKEVLRYYFHCKESGDC